MPDKTVYIKSETTGGAAIALDGINGNALKSSDKAFVFSSDLGTFSAYELTSDGTTEIAPWRIQPDTNSSSWSWRLMKGLNNTPQRFASTGGTILPYGKVLLDFSSSGGSGSFTLRLGTPSSGASVDITVVGASSHFIKVITDNTGTTIGTSQGGSRHIWRHDSNLNVTLNSPPAISLVAFGSSQWLIFNSQSSGSATLTTALS